MSDDHENIKVVKILHIPRSTIRDSVIMWFITNIIMIMGFTLFLLATSEFEKKLMIVAGFIISMLCANIFLPGLCADASKKLFHFIRNN